MTSSLLYDADFLGWNIDFLGWNIEQSESLRLEKLDSLNLDNLVEEIESLSKQKQ
ncbi:MAG: DUF29 domain-containing protein [Pseudanabaena sp. CAN_BIN31]|nr:DUF29 domain-containing protein [Pseudanabaena sp. CAN_BIN31]